MKCPICNGELTRDKETGAVFCCGCKTIFRNEAVLQTVNVKGGDISESKNSENVNLDNNVSATNDNLVSQNGISAERAKDSESVLSNNDNEIEELKARLAKLEKDKQNSSLNKFKQAMAPVVEFLKKWGLKAVLPAVLIFVTFVTLLCCLAGLRGIYVNVDDPNEFYSFTAGKYQSYSEFGTEVLCEEGSWNKSGNELTLKIKDENFGDYSDDLSFKKLDGYDLIEIEGSKYKRVSIICYKDSVKKATVTFDSQGGSPVAPIKNKIGNKIKEFKEPVKLGYDFSGWYTAPQGSKNAEPVSLSDRIWEDVTYYAHWNVNSTLVDYDFVANATGITIQKFNNQTATKVIVPDLVTKIEDYAFYGCSNLTSITIPETVTSIGASAFSGCSNLMICVKAATKPSGWDSGWNPDNCLVYWGWVKAADCLIFNPINDNMTYEIGGIKKEYKTRNISFIIPNVYNIRRVTSIGASAFWGCSGLTSITIPDSVTSIGNWAFDGCSGLTSITIPDSVTSIGYGAFDGCSGLTNITIPDSVTSIGSGGFSGCSGLISITVESGNTKYHSSGNCIIETETKTLVAGCKNSVIPTDGSVTSIGNSAFYGCRGLTSITIPDSVTNIGEDAFYNCSGLTSITIPDGVTSIGSHAFSGCSSLTSITIPDSVTGIGLYAFEGCSGLTSITVERGNTKYHSSGNCLIETETKTLVAGCDNSVIPTDGSVTSIGDYAFEDCSGLTSITIPSSVTSIGRYAFDGCNSLTSITIPNSVTIIGSGAFYGCSRLTSITIPVGVTSIGGYAFKGCSGLTSITIPDGVTSIGESAFNGCSGLTSITIPNNVTSIGDRAFKDCNSITSITIPDSVTSIGEFAFYNCSGLKSITIPSSVTSIGLGVFYGCSNLTSITIPNSVTSIGASAFYGCSRLTSITIPVGVTSIGDYAFKGCSGLTSITIPDSVTSIGNYAFRECSGLTIYAEAAAKPAGWSSSWNYSDRPVVWGYKG